jgi:hypothetical protein
MPRRRAESRDVSARPTEGNPDPCGEGVVDEAPDEQAAAPSTSAEISEPRITIRSTASGTVPPFRAAHHPQVPRRLFWENRA